MKKSFHHQPVLWKSNRPYLLLKDVFREEGTLWLIKWSGERNLNDVEHFNTPPYVWQLIAKHVDNNEREKPIIARNMWLWYYVKVQWALLSKNAFRENETLWLIKCLGERNLNDVGRFNRYMGVKNPSILFLLALLNKNEGFVSGM